jgi:hypothetical protein
MRISWGKSTVSNYRLPPLKRSSFADELVRAQLRRNFGRVDTFISPRTVTEVPTQKFDLNILTFSGPHGASRIVPELKHERVTGLPLTILPKSVASPGVLDAVYGIVKKASARQAGVEIIAAFLQIAAGGPQLLEGIGDILLDLRAIVGNYSYFLSLRGPGNKDSQQAN